jgi:hypothetical protein
VVKTAKVLYVTLTLKYDRNKIVISRCYVLIGKILPTTYSACSSFAFSSPRFALVLFAFSRTCYMLKTNMHKHDGYVRQGTHTGWHKHVNIATVTHLVNGVRYVGWITRMKLWPIINNYLIVEYFNPLKAQWSFYVPPGLTFINPTFCSHSMFMCFVWISEQTAIISIHSINWLVFITETECVYCAVRTGSLYIIKVNFCL